MSAKPEKRTSVKIIRNPKSYPPGAFVYEYEDGLQLICQPDGRSWIKVPGRE
jgi:hypothetical protein